MFSQAWHTEGLLSFTLYFLEKEAKDISEKWHQLAVTGFPKSLSFSQDLRTVKYFRYSVREIFSLVKSDINGILICAFDNCLLG